MSWEFRVGQKVVCVNDTNWLRPGLSSNHPKKGEVYTISLIRSVKHGLLGCELSEFPEIRTSGTPSGYLLSRFRPLVTDTQPWLKEVLENPPLDELEIAGGGGARL